MKYVIGGLQIIAVIYFVFGFFIGTNALMIGHYMEGIKYWTLAISLFTLFGGTAGVLYLLKRHRLINQVEN